MHYIGLLTSCVSLDSRIVDTISQLSDWDVKDMTWDFYECVSKTTTTKNFGSVIARE